MMGSLSCGYWVSSSPDDPKGHVCAKPSVAIAQRRVLGEERGYCVQHATSKRLQYLLDTGWTVTWLD